MLKGYVFLLLGLVGIVYSTSCILNMVYEKAVKKEVSKVSTGKAVAMIVATIYFLSKMEYDPVKDLSGPFWLLFLIGVSVGLVGVGSLFIERIKSSERTIERKSKR